MELCLILLKPWSDIANIVIHDPLDHLLIWRDELTGAQTSTASPVCSDLLLSHTLSHCFRRQTDTLCKHKYPISTLSKRSVCFYNYTRFIYRMTSLFSVLYVCVITDCSGHWTRLQKHLFGHLIWVQQVNLNRNCCGFSDVIMHWISPSFRLIVRQKIFVDVNLSFRKVWWEVFAIF